MALNDFAVFVDRDGTINVDVDFLSSPAQLQLIPRSAAAIRELNDLNIPVIVITNQSGIARGIFTEQDLAVIHTALDEELKRHGASVTAYYYCPHHPREGNAPYVQDCECRKPKTGMLRDAQSAFGLDLSRSFVVGDKLIDVKTGKAAGARAIHVATGYGAAEMALSDGIRDHAAADLYDAVQYIKSCVTQ